MDVKEEELIEQLVDALWEERQAELEEYLRDAVSAEVKAEMEEERKQEMQERANAGPSFVDPDQIPDYEKEAKEKQQEEERRIEQKQKEVLEEMNIVCEEHLVRGAMLRCKCGSHCRRLNLPLMHGYMEAKRPLVNAEDSIAGENDNIPYFGVCSSGTNDSGAETVFLKKDYERDILGRKVSEETEGNVKGKCCTPVILGSWQNVQEGTIIDGAPAITPSSFLVCKYGGIIEALDSGQHDEETMIEEVKS